MRVHLDRLELVVDGVVPVERLYECANPKAGKVAVWSVLTVIIAAFEAMLGIALDQLHSCGTQVIQQASSSWQRACRRDKSHVHNK